MSQFNQVGGIPLVGAASNGTPILGVDSVNNGVYASTSGTWGYLGPTAYLVLPAQTAAVINTATTLLNTVPTLPANFLNQVGKTMRITGNGVYSNTTSTPTVAITIILGSVTLLTLTSEAVTNAVTNQAFSFQALLTTVTAGSSGTIESHGRLDILLGSSATAPVKSYLDGNTAVSSAVDLTTTETLNIKGLSAGASNAATLRQLVVEMLF